MCETVSVCIVCVHVMCTCMCVLYHMIVVCTHRCTCTPGEVIWCSNSSSVHNMVYMMYAVDCCSLELSYKNINAYGAQHDLPIFTLVQG